MKKLILNVLKIFLGLLTVLILTAAFAYFYLNAKGLNFEGEYEEKGAEIKELSIDGIRFLDRNRNQKLDVYEDARESLERRAEDLLSQMTLEEKIHLLGNIPVSLGRWEMTQDSSQIENIKNSFRPLKVSTN